MMTVLSVLALLLVAVTMGLSLAHALEFPGKLRLDEPTYRAVQAIYYPGFTIGGLVGEVGGMLALVALLLLTPPATERFWWTVAALGSLLIGHATYWVVNHPVNAAWLKDTNLTGMSRTFFGLFSATDADWRHMRNVWEWSHVARGPAPPRFLSVTLALIRRGAGPWQPPVRPGLHAGSGGPGRAVRHPGNLHRARNDPDRRQQGAHPRREAGGAPAAPSGPAAGRGPGRRRGGLVPPGSPGSCSSSPAEP